MKDKFVNRIKEKYKEPEVPIDVDVLWKDIDRRITEKKRRGFVPILIGLLGICTMVYLSFPGNSTIGETEGILTLEQGKNVDQIENKVRHFENEITEVVDQQNNHSVTIKSDEEDVAILEENKEAISIEQTKEVFVDTRDISTPTDEQKELVENIPVRTRKDKANSGFKEKTTNQRLSDSAIPEVEKRGLEHIDQLASLSFLKIESKQRRNIVVNLVETDELQSEAANQHSMVGIEWTMGAALFSEQIKSTSETYQVITQSQIDHRTSLESVSFAGLVTYNLSETFSLKTGLRYEQFNTRFDFDGTYDETYDREEVDTIIITGLGPDDFMELSSEREVSRTVNRQTKHYNHHRFFNLPILIGLRINKAKWSPEFVLGPSFNLRSTASGLMLNESLVPASYDPEIYKTRIGVGMHTAFNMHYDLSEKIGLVFGLQANYLPNLTSENHYFSQSLISYGTQVGVVMQL